VAKLGQLWPLTGATKIYSPKQWEEVVEQIISTISK